MLDEWNVRHLDEQAMLASYVAALDGADIIVSGAQSMTQSYSVAERNKVTWIPLFLGNCPLPTSAFPHGLPRAFHLDSSVQTNGHTLLSHRRHGSTSVKPSMPGASKSWVSRPSKLLWESYNLVNANDSTMYQAASTLLCGPSKHVPSDYLKGKVVYGGFLHHTDSPPNHTALQRFLKLATLPAISICFGTMAPFASTRQLVQFADQVAKLAKVQCVLFVPEAKSNLSTLAAKYAERLHIEQSQPPTWLLSRMSCNVHHASLNSTAMALARGVPQIPCPMMMDQFHHANELLALGVAPAVVYKAALSAKARLMRCANCRSTRSACSRQEERHSNQSAGHRCVCCHGE
ncbi:unnamed protein product [Aphanomyces euteiches]